MIQFNFKDPGFSGSDETAPRLNSFLGGGAFVRILKFLIPVALIAIFLSAPQPQAWAFGEAKPNAAADVKDPLHANLRLQPSTVEPGGTTDLIIDLELAENYHAYLERFKVVIESPDDLKLDGYKITPTVKFMDTVSHKEKEGVAGHATLHALMEVPSGFRSGTNELHIKLTYQACTEDHCLFPKSIELRTPLTTLQPIAARAAITPSAAIPSSDFEQALHRGLLAAFLLMFAVGFLTSLTPCIYPMIPITLAVLGARSKDQSHFKNFSLAFIYVLGIACTYSLLGLAAATTGSLFGSALSNVWVVSAIAIVFIAMGLSMFGLFEVQAPAFIRNKLGAARTTSGYGGAFATGLIAGVVASPCIGPVLVSVLAYIAQTRNQALGFFLLFTFSMGMGVPFIVLGLSSSWISHLPKAGGWMDSVKLLFGSLMIGMAFYYIFPLYPPWLFRALLGMALILYASTLGAFAATAKLPAVGRIRKGLMLAIFELGCVFLIVGVMNKSGLSLDPSTSTAQLESPATSLLNWQPYSSSALEGALKNGQPVLIDFSAEWCGACKEMDRSTFVDNHIAEIAHQFSLLKIDGTEESPELKALIEKYKVQGFPTYIFYDKSGVLRPDLSVFGFEAAVPFAKRMEAALLK